MSKSIGVEYERAPRRCPTPGGSPVEKRAAPPCGGSPVEKRAAPPCGLLAGEFQAPIPSHRVCDEFMRRGTVPGPAPCGVPGVWCREPQFTGRSGVAGVHRPDGALP